MQLSLRVQPTEWTQRLLSWSTQSTPEVVGRLTIPKQDMRSPRGQKLNEYVEALSFDPWHALVEHRPLGDMMRARNVAYRVKSADCGSFGAGAGRPVVEPMPPTIDDELNRNAQRF